MKNLFSFTAISLIVNLALGHASDHKIEQDDKPKNAPTATTNTNIDKEHNYAKAKQLEWGQHYIEDRTLIVSANPQIDPFTSFNKLSLSEKPHPQLFQLYFRSNENESYKLIRDSSSPSFKIVKVYSSSKEPKPNYTTSSPTPNFHETHSHTRPGKAEERGSISTKKSYSYPEGCYTYYYFMPSGYELRFDRGHGTDDFDTIRHASGTQSTKDPDNFVPQNVKYNSPIRRCLVDELRQKGLNYHEISLYHPKCNYHVRYRKNTKDFYSDLPIPEGFIFLAHNPEGQIIRSYYFPNFINYDELNLHSPYLESCRLFELGDLQEWLWNPSVTMGNVEDHLEKVELAQMLVEKLLLRIPTFFRNLTETQMPPKARVTLFSTLLEWNIQSAASLEFIGLERQIKLAYFYTVPRVFHELDDRYEADKNNALAVVLKDNEISEEARKILEFLFKTKISFLKLQDILNQLISLIEATKQSSPDYWQNAQIYLTHPRLYDYFSVWTNDLKDIKVENSTLQFSLSRLKPESDLQKLLNLKGGFEVRDLEKAATVLRIVEARAQKTGTTVIEKLHLMRLYHDTHLFHNKAKMEIWEQALVKQASEPTDVSLLDKRRIADFYGTRGMEDKKRIWLNHLVNHLEKEPTISNFLSIAQWCFQVTGAFLQDKKEAQDAQPLRASTQLGLQILFGLGKSNPLIHAHAIEAANSLGILDRFLRNYQSHLRDNLLLVPFLSDNNATAQALLRISNIFEDNLESLK